MPPMSRSLSCSRKTTEQPPGDNLPTHQISCRKSAENSVVFQPFVGALSMNRPSPGLRPPSPRLAGRGQGEGCQSGSWSQCMRKSERRLSMKRNGEHSLASERAGQIEGNQGGHFPSAFSRRCQTEESNQVRRVEFHA